jgi:hypothetical protein
MRMTMGDDEARRRTSCALSCIDDAIPFDSVLADASRESRTHSLDAIRALKIEASMS